MKTTYKFLIGGSVIFLAIVALSLQKLEEQTVFFYTPKELIEKGTKLKSQTIRVGALVQKGSLQWESRTLNLSFQITDQLLDASQINESSLLIPVKYQGAKPDMFKEGQGVVVEGKWDGQTFYASQLLVKHSEEYSIVDEKKDSINYYQTIITQ